MLRSLLRSISAAPAKSNLIASAVISSSHSTPHHLTSSRTFATKKPKPSPSKGGSKKPQQKSKSDPKSKSKQDEIVASSSLDDAAHDVISDEKNRRRLLDEDERDKSLDVGPNGRPLFTSASSLAELNRKDACSYIKFRYYFFNLLIYLFRLILLLTMYWLRKWFIENLQLRCNKLLLDFVIVRYQLFLSPFNVTNFYYRYM